MASRFTLPHIDISLFKSTSEYQGSGQGGSGDARVRAEHGRRLSNELNAAFAAADASMPSDSRLPAPEGTYIEVELRKGAKTDILERKTDKIKPGAVKIEDGSSRIVALFVPDHARPALQKILEDYTNGPLSEKTQNPQRMSIVEPIEAFRQARLETFWTDSLDSLPRNPQDQIWWALWCWPSSEVQLENACQRLDLRVVGKDRRLYFPETTIIPVLATRSAIELLLFATGAIAELRRANDSPVFYLEEVRNTQQEWVDDLAARIIWPPSTSPSVCLLDTGVNRSHALIEPALAPKDLHTIMSDWGTDDHTGHGTAIAGLALHGCLTAQLSDSSEKILTHRLESVKLLPPNGFDPNDPNSYGIITQAAVALPEIAAPDRTRVFCMAVSNDNVSGAIASTWSAAIDQAAAASMIGDDDNSPRRLFVIATGNTPPEMDAKKLMHNDNYPIEDPAQAWNALTIGGYTDLIDITDSGYSDWSALAAAGELSPHSRTSVNWPHNQAPFKPELVLEAGNRGLSPSKNEVLTFESLSLLSTGNDIGIHPLVPFQATSAATAQAARMAARLVSAHPDYWPETIRALMVHSAVWTEPMLAYFNNASTKKDKYELVRRFGYGVPDYERAANSAKNHLALIAQSDIQPFRVEGTRKFNECHYYKLPLPNLVLEQLGNDLIELKITLSYFVEPNPGLSANIDPQRYQSHGLRFDLRRKGESILEFKRRVNASEPNDQSILASPEPDDNRWLLGSQSVSSGSLHCDVWKGPAIELLRRDMLCIKPVNGWWRMRAKADLCNKQTRYALIITIKTNNIEIDLHTPIQALVDAHIPVTISV